MAEHYTSKIQLAYPDFGANGWNTDVEGNYTALDALAALGSLAVGFAETPSASLNVKVAAGSFRKGDGTVVTYAGTSSFGCTTATTNYVYLSDAGTLTKSTTAFPKNCVPLATVVAGASTLTSIADSRAPWALVGTDTPTIGAGTGAGTSPTVTVTGSDRAGLISVLTGTSPAASATVATVTFGTAFGAAPKAVTLTPAGPNVAALSGNAAVYLDSASTTTAHFLLKVGSTQLGAATTYLWHYLVVP